MDRAYSVLDVKSLDEEQRTITGIATTPATDLMEDVVEPMGGVYTIPIPFLMDHGKGGSDDSVGHVLFAKPTAKGIEVRIQVLKDAALPHLDKAWAKIKLGLVRGLSIGFKPIESEPIKDSMFGRRFTKWRWLELSGVVIPANQDASIISIKSIDTQQRAALGRNAAGVVRLDSTAGASAPKQSPEEGRSMDVGKEIKSFEAKRMASADRMEAIMQKAADEGRTLDEAEDEEYQTVTAEVESVDKHLVKLRALESAQAARAKAVPKFNGIEDAGKARDPATVHVTLEENLPKGIEFARYVKCLAAARGNRWEALEMAKANYPQHPRIATVLKAAVAAGTTTDATWAGPFVEYATLVSEFIDYLRPQTIIGKFGTGGVPSLNNVPFNVRIQEQTSPGAGYWVGEGAPKPLTSFDFTSRTFGWAKVANIAVLTDELVRFSNPSADLRVRQSLADALRARLDIDFIDPAKAAVANVSPASITNGLTAITSSGTGVDGVRADLEAMLAAFSTAGLTPNAIIMSSGNALALSMMVGPLGQPAFEGVSSTGGSFRGLPVIVSEYVTQVGDSSGSPIIMLNTNEVYLADDGQVTIDASREASLEMLDNPTNNSATGTATSLVSMFQTNSVALKAERYINWARRRDAGVQYIEAAAYTSVTT